MAVRVRAVVPRSAVYLFQDISNAAVLRRTEDIGLDCHWISIPPAPFFYSILVFIFIAFWSVRGRRLDAASIAPPDGSD